MRKSLKIGMLLFILTMLVGCSGPSDDLQRDALDDEALAPDAVGLIEEA